MICRNFARASAPAKVILFGEHFVVYGGPAILGSIDKRIRVSARPIASTKIKINSDIGYFASYPSDRLIESRPHFTEAERILYPLYTATHKVLKDHLIGTAKSIGVEIQLSSDIPLGAGLGSSAASCVATVAAVGSLFLRPDKDWVCSMALRAEKIIHENSSGADCYVSSFGGLIYFVKNIMNKKIRPKKALSLIVVNTGIKHSTKTLVSLVKNYRLENMSLYNDLANRAASICEQAVLAINLGDQNKLGQLMNENHTLLNELGVSNEIINDLVGFCIDKGASGAKVTGAGGGGSIVVLIPDEYETSIISEISKKYSHQCISTRIGSGGLLTY
jgi:mevalonate kinase